MSRIISRLGLNGSVWAYAVELLPLLAVTAAVYLIVSILRNKRRGVRVRPLRKLATLAFVCYCAGVAGLVLVPLNFWYSMEAWILGGVWPPSWVRLLGTGAFNFVPTFVKVLTGQVTTGAWVRAMGMLNILLFVPMGFLPPLLWKRLASWRGLALGVGVSLAIELLQPLIGRDFDVDDLMANAIGTAVGLCVCLLLGRVLPGFVALFRKQPQPDSAP